MELRTGFGDLSVHDAVQLIGRITDHFDCKNHDNGYQKEEQGIFDEGGPLTVH